jgi:hypothetical protein
MSSQSIYVSLSILSLIGLAGAVCAPPRRACVEESRLCGF